MRIAATACLLILLTFSWSTGLDTPFPFVVEPAHDVQAAFSDVVGASSFAPGWIGADCASSLRFVNGSTLWLWGDTFVGVVNTTEQQRSSPAYMPHGSLGISTSPSGRDLRMLINTTQEGVPTAIFEPADPNPAAEYFWTMQGLLIDGNIGLCNTGDEHSQLLLIADRIRNLPDPGPMSFRVVASSVISVTNPSADWRDWQYSACEIPGSGELGITWTTALIAPGSGADEAGIDGRTVQPVPSGNTTLYVFGSRNLRNGLLPQAVVLMRVPAAALAVCDLSAAAGAEFLVTAGRSPFDPGVWSSDMPADASAFHAVLPIALPEASVYWHAQLGVWLLPAIPFLSNDIQLWYAEQLEGPWLLHPRPLLSIPWPWRDDRYFSYAPKFHPDPAATAALEQPSTMRVGLLRHREVVNANCGAEVREYSSTPRSKRVDNSSGLLFSFNSNAWWVQDLFAPGALSIYVPQFYRLFITEGE